MLSPSHADWLGAAAQRALHKRGRRSRQVAAGGLSCRHGQVWIEAHVHQRSHAQGALVTGGESRESRRGGAQLSRLTTQGRTTGLKRPPSFASWLSSPRAPTHQSKSPGAASTSSEQTHKQRPSSCVQQTTGAQKLVRSSSLLHEPQRSVAHLQVALLMLQLLLLARMHLHAQWGMFDAAAGRTSRAGSGGTTPAGSCPCCHLHTHAHSRPIACAQRPAPTPSRACGQTNACAPGPPTQPAPPAAPWTAQTAAAPPAASACTA